MSKVQIENASRLQDRTPSPPTKRIRRPLNFSIESIMQPSQRQQPTEASMATAASRSPSPGSEADSRCGGPISLSGSSSSISSRVSSPISPGGREGSNDNHQSSNNHHQLNQRESVHQDFRKQDFTSNQHNSINNNSNQLAGTSSKPTQIKSSLTKSSRSGHQSSNSRLRPVCTDQRLAPFECHLDNPNLWHNFHELDTEMIITKQGRRMFPPVKVTFSFNDQLLHHQQQQQATSCNQPPQLQFNSRDKYQVLMDILPYDNKRYRYAYHKSSWQGAGKADPPSPPKLFLHPDGPFTLEQLKRQVISFEKIKLTNNDANKHGHIVLNSMHKYQPRIHLILWRGKESQSLANGPVSLLEQEAHKTFIFSETIFTAVTAYQNHSITKLKIDSNPFAKGFRDSTRLTDLELESMHDLIADGQCPFSPPRAPPAGFPHFLFAAAAQQQHHHHHHQQQQQQQQQSHTTPYSNNQAFGPVGIPPPLPPPPPYHFSEPSGGASGNIQLGPPGSDEATLALFRDRTLMAFDSLFQQQSSSSVSPHQLASASMSPRSRQEQLRSSSSESANGGGQQQICNQSNNAIQQHQQQRPPVSEHSFNPAHFAKALLASGQPNSALMGALPPPPPPTSKAALVGQIQLEQFILQQKQFAAAMAAAAASGVHAHQHPAAYQLQTLFAQAVQQQQQQQQKNLQAPQLVGSTSPRGACKLDRVSSPPAGRQMAQQNHILSNSQQQEQTSPIGMAKSANHQLQLDLNQFLSQQHQHHNHDHQNQAPQLGTGVNANSAQSHQEHINQQHTIQAIMQQQHMQQMAALAHGHHQAHLQPNQTGGAFLQMEPLLGLQDAGLGSRRAAAKTHK